MKKKEKKNNSLQNKQKKSNKLFKTVLFAVLEHGSLRYTQFKSGTCPVLQNLNVHFPEKSLFCKRPPYWVRQQKKGNAVKHSIICKCDLWLSFTYLHGNGQSLGKASWLIAAGDVE